MGSDTASARTGPLWWTGRIMSWVILLCCAGLLVIMVIVPRVAGATPYTVLTGSMTPAYPPGTLVVIKPVDTKSIGIGTVITYQLKSGEPAVVTHRVIAVGYDAHGDIRYTTKGDANNTPDSTPVRPVQVRGALWYSVPLLGYLNTWLTGTQHTVILYAVVGGLLLYAGYMFASAGLDRARRRRHSAQAVHDGDAR